MADSIECPAELPTQVISDNVIYFEDHLNRQKALLPSSDAADIAI
jgi:hypothetical protein